MNNPNQKGGKRTGGLTAIVQPSNSEPSLLDALFDDFFTSPPPVVPKPSNEPKQSTTPSNAAKKSTAAKTTNAIPKKTASIPAPKVTKPISDPAPAPKATKPVPNPAPVPKATKPVSNPAPAPKVTKPNTTAAEVSKKPAAASKSQPSTTNENAAPRILIPEKEDEVVFKVPLPVKPRPKRKHEDDKTETLMAPPSKKRVRKPIANIDVEEEEEEHFLEMEDLVPSQEEQEENLNPIKDDDDDYVVDDFAAAEEDDHISSMDEDEADDGVQQGIAIEDLPVEAIPIEEFIAAENAPQYQVRPDLELLHTARENLQGPAPTPKQYLQQRGILPPSEKSTTSPSFITPRVDGAPHDRLLFVNTDFVLEHDVWPESTDLACWHCTYRFKGSPFRVFEGDWDAANGILKDIYGNWCSPRCCRSYYASRNWPTLGKIIMNISVVCSRALNLDPRMVGGYAPPMEMLRKYGGCLDIETFRRTPSDVCIRAINKSILQPGTLIFEAVRATRGNHLVDEATNLANDNSPAAAQKWLDTWYAAGTKDGISSNGPLPSNDNTKAIAISTPDIFDEDDPAPRVNHTSVFHVGGYAYYQAYERLRLPT